MAPPGPFEDSTSNLPHEQESPPLRRSPVMVQGCRRKLTPAKVAQPIKGGPEGATSRSRPFRYVWTPKVLKNIALWAMFGGFGLFFYRLWGPGS